MEPEQRLDQELLSPPHAISHGADYHVLSEDHADVTRKEEVGQRRKREAHLVQRPRNRPALLFRALDEHLHDLLGGEGAEPLTQVIRGDHIHCLADQVFTGVGLLQDVGEQIADVAHFGKPAQHRGKLTVLPLGNLEIDDIVVEVIFPVAGSDRLELGPRGVYQYGPQRTYFRADVNGHTTSYLGSSTKG